MTAAAPDPRPVGPPVPFDAELAPVLEQVADLVPKAHTLDEIPAARAYRMPGVEPTSLEALRQDGDFDVTERYVPGPQGQPDIRLVILRPAGVTGPLPALFHVHGGGMIMFDALALPLEWPVWLREFGVAMISVDYRLAPESPHPGPVEDCYAGLTWTADHAAELDIDPDRLVIVGASAGGGLSAATTLLARDRGGPALAAQMLMCPMLDDRNDSPSAVQGAGRGVWDQASNLVGWTALLGERRGGPDVSPYAAPARETDLSRLPPTYIDVGSAETFRDEAVAYASGIWRSGGIADLHVFAGGFHGYEAFAPDAAVSRETRAARTAWLRRILG